MTTVITRVAEWNNVAAWLRRDELIGLVPTMGALHDGHGALLDEARRRCSVVVASIFVNPIQFNQKSDYDRYPRPLAEDVEFCKKRGVDYVFAPPDDEMYPEPQRVFVEVEDVSEHLCGRYRPGHFRGVATVVMKLFQMSAATSGVLRGKGLSATGGRTASCARPERASASGRCSDGTRKGRPGDEFPEPPSDAERAVLRALSLQSLAGGPTS